MLKADLHIHSTFSRDSDSTPREIVDAALERSLDAIAVTDHDSLEGSRATATAAEEAGADLLVVPGQEASTMRGHVLVLGPDEPTPRKSRVDRLIEWTHERGGICVAPHPFQRYRHGIGKGLLYAAEPMDGVEVCNSRHILPLGDRRAEKLANRYGYPRLGGSDAHIPEMVGRVYTLVDAEPSIEGVLDAVREGRTEVRRGRTPTVLFTKQLLGTLRSRFTA